MTQASNVRPMVWGADPADWDRLIAAGLTADLLPVVSNPKARISPLSTLKALGKTPSRYNSAGLVGGFKDWTQHRSTPGEVARWRTETDYGICIQTRHLRAIDIDIPDPGLAGKILSDIMRLVGHPLPVRYRANSGKCLVAFRLEGDYTKRLLRCGEHGIIEFLAEGQQFVAAGCHESGVRYEWRGPVEFPELDSETYETLFMFLSEAYAVEVSTAKATTRTAVLSSAYAGDRIAQRLQENGLVIAQKGDKLLITCPWKDEHSSDSGDTETIYYAPHTGGYSHGGFDCKHAHCEHRTVKDLEEVLGFTVADEFDDIPDDELDGTSPEPSKREKFTPVPAAEFTGAPPQGYLIKGVLPMAAPRAAVLALMYGASGSGKSFAATDLACHVALGLPWRSNRVTKGRVVYVCAEGAGGYRKRLVAFCRHHKLDIATLDVWVVPAAPSLLSGPDVSDLIRAVHAVGPVALVVIDTLAQTTPGGNENSSEDMGMAIGHCRTISEVLGATVLLIHHSGKNEDNGARGHSSLRAAADTEIVVARGDDRRAMKVTKQKDGEEGQDLGFELKAVTLGTDEDGDPITSCVVIYTDDTVAEVRSAKKENMGEVERLLVSKLDAYLELSGETEKDLVNLLEEVKEDLPRGDSKQDQRRTRVKKAAERLVSRGKLVLFEGKVRRAGR